MEKLASTKSKIRKQVQSMHQDSLSNQTELSTTETDSLQLGEIIRITCNYTDPPHFHDYPSDWIFGGADGTHPAPDPRWRSTTYVYLDAEFKPVYMTSEYLCDDEAIDKFTWVRDSIQGAKPKYLMAQRPGESKPKALPWIYDIKTDEAIYSPPPSC
jgi:hypothetical protein